MTRLIGLTGWAQVGKDSAAKAVGWRRLAFADALKRDLLPPIEMMGLDFDKDKSLLRPLMVEYGRLGRAIHPDYWIHRLSGPVDAGDYVCVTDVRYFNEASWILDHDGEVIYIDRPGYGPANEEEKRSIAELVNRLGTDRGYTIPVVVNDGTIEELGRKVLETAGKP